MKNQQSTMTRARRILKRLRTQGTNAPVELSYTNPFELLVATILSAQCTDERVNRVTPALFAAYPGARELAGASQAKLEALIKPTGFYRNKAQHLVKCSQALVSQFQGDRAQDHGGIDVVARDRQKDRQRGVGRLFPRAGDYRGYARQTRGAAIAPDPEYRSHQNRI